MTEGWYILMGTVLGGAIAAVTSWLVTCQYIRQMRLDRRQRLSFVAAEKRLEIYQEAYNKLRDVFYWACRTFPTDKVNPFRDPEMEKLHVKTKNALSWLQGNCLYMSSTVLWAVEEAIVACSEYPIRDRDSFSNDPDKKKLYDDCLGKIFDGFNVIRNAFGLPDLNDLSSLQK